MRGRLGSHTGEKTADAIQKEIEREVDPPVSVVFNSRRKTGLVDLEAIEMAVRTIACFCGQQAKYLELRSKTLLTAVGKVEISRPYYLCPHCHSGQFPADIELDVENTAASPGVRRMLATVGRRPLFITGDGR